MPFLCFTLFLKAFLVVVFGLFFSFRNKWNSVKFSCFFFFVTYILYRGPISVAAAHNQTIIFFYWRASGAEQSERHTQSKATEFSISTTDSNQTHTNNKMKTNEKKTTLFSVVSERENGIESGWHGMLLYSIMWMYICGVLYSLCCVHHDAFISFWV